MENTASFSKIIAGTMLWGSWGKQLSKAEKADLMHHCLALGITTFDHADIYGGYTNEADFGNAFLDSGIVRENIQLISKCGIQYVCGARDNKIKHYEYSKDYIIWSAEESLRNLKTDYLDLFLLHRPSPLMRPETIAEAVQSLLKDGKIRKFGVSNFTPSQIAMLETAVPVYGNQVEFSLTSDKAMYDGTLDDMIAGRRLAMAWSPLGTYYKEEDERIDRIRTLLRSMTVKYASTEDQLLLAWILKHPANVHPVVGTADKVRVRNAVNATKIELDTEDWFFMLNAAQGHKVP